MPPKTPATKKRRGRPPKSTSTTTPVTKPATAPKRKRSRSKYSSVHTFTWEKVDNGYKTSTEQFTAQIYVHVYNSRVVYYAVHVIPKLGYQLPQDTYPKWHSTLPSAITVFLKMANNIIANKSIEQEFNQMVEDLNNYMDNPNTILPEEQPEELALEDE